MAEAIANAGLEVADIDWLLLHQANIRIMEHVAREMGISMDKVLRNIDEYGNTSAGECNDCCVCFCLTLLMMMMMLILLSCVVGLFCCHIFCFAVVWNCYLR